MNSKMSKKTRRCIFQDSLKIKVKELKSASIENFHFLNKQLKEDVNNINELLMADFLK